MMPVVVAGAWGTCIRRSVCAALLLLTIACEEHRAAAPALQQTATAAPRPEPPSPRDNPSYPLWREPRRGDPVRDPAVRPRLIQSVPAEYSEQARKARISGIVILELIIEPDGRVSGGKVLKPLPLGLTQKAIDAVQHWRFTPAENPRGHRVRAIHNVTVNFKM